MTISLLLSNITSAIKNLKGTGVTIRDYTGIASSWKSVPNVLYPNPENFIVFNPPQYATMLRGANAPADFSYTLNYRFLSTALADVGDTTGYSDMIDKVQTIYEVIAATDAPYSGKVQMELGQITVGARSDPAGNMYHGADFALNITEMQN